MFAPRGARWAVRASGVDSKGVMGMPGRGVWRRGMPASKASVERVWTVRPVWESPARRAWWIGAGPRRLWGVSWGLERGLKEGPGRRVKENKF